jgi:DNA-directed RNA polymerase alpha subunit
MEKKSNLVVREVQNMTTNPIPKIVKMNGESNKDPNKGYFKIKPFSNSTQANAYITQLRQTLNVQILPRQFDRVKFRLDIGDKEDQMMIHEYAPIFGIKESVPEILKNLSRVQFLFDINDQKDTVIYEIVGEGMGPVTNKSIVDSHNLLVQDQPEFILFTIEEPDLKLILKVESRPCSKVADIDDESNWIHIVRKNPIIQRSFSQLSLEGKDHIVKFFVDTDGSITPKDALIQARKAIYQEHCNYAEILEVESDLDSIEDSIVEELDELTDQTSSNSDSLSQKSEPSTILSNPADSRDIQKSSGKSSLQETSVNLASMRLEDLGISARTCNVLKRAQIHTVEDIQDYSQTDLLEIQAFGIKSANEVVEALSSKLGIRLPD